MGDPQYTIKATQTSFEILELVRDEGALTTTEITQEVGLAKSAVHKHLQTLTDLKYLTREEYEYQLGLQCFTLGIASRDAHRLFEVARDDVDKLAKGTGEQVSIVIVENDTGYCLYSCTGENQDRRTERDGELFDPYHSAAGHSLVKQDSETDYSPDQNTPSETGITHEQGLTFSVETNESAQNSVAAPISGSNTQPIGALEVTGPARRLSGKRLKEDLAGLVLSSVTSIEKQIRH